MSDASRESYREDLLEFARRRQQQAKQDDRGTVEAHLVQAYLSANGSTPTCKNLVDTVLEAEGRNDPKLHSWLSSRRASNILRGMGFVTRHTNRGSEATIEHERLAALCRRYGIDSTITSTVTSR